MSRNSSFVCGVGTDPLRYVTIGQALAQAAERWGSREALVVRHQGVRWTWAELLERADAFARGLIGLGLNVGDRVGIWSPNNAEWVVAQLATARAGLILVNINPAYRKSELAFTLQKTGCSALILAHRFKTSDYVRMMRELAPELDRQPAGACSLDAFPTLRSLIVIGDETVPGMLRFGDVAAAAPADAAEELERRLAACQPDDAINIQFTSGTTGLPKGAVLSHFNVLNNGYFSGRAMRLGEADRICIPVPLYHCFGMVLGVLACLTHGACMVFPSEAFEADAVLAAVAEERCTALHGVPTMFIAALEEPAAEQTDFSSLRTGIMAGAPCPTEVMRRVMEVMNLREITIAYGMTETSPVTFQCATDDPLAQRVETVGRVHPHVQAKVVDDEGRVVPRGVEGELHARGYCVMLGYWEDEEKTRETVDSAGWMHTGDLAVIDDDGYCRIVGRVKDMIIRGGENIYPREIEEFLYGHPKIQDVAVFGVPDPKYGEAVAAWIQLHEGETCSDDEIRDFCRDQIAHYKIPRHIRFVQDFPMTVTGKIQKFAMREQMVADAVSPEQGVEQESAARRRTEEPVTSV